MKLRGGGREQMQKRGDTKRKTVGCWGSSEGVWERVRYRTMLGTSALRHKEYS